MSKKTYTVVYGPTGWECQVAIDWADRTNIERRIKDMVEFWAGWQFRLKENNDDYLKIFLQDLAREILFMIAENDYNLIGVIDEFKHREGWYLMDGSLGFEIIEVDDFDFSHSEFEVMEDPQ